MNKTELIIAEGGKCLSEIILPEEPNAIELFAKEEMAHYLQLMTAGSQLEENNHGEEAPVIRFVRNNAGKKFWQPDTDHFNIKTEGREIKLIGAGRALLYAVYHLLEYFGARFYFPSQEDTILPVAERLKLPISYAVAEESLFPYRAIDLECLLKRDWNLILGHIDWMAKNRFNILSTHPDSYGADSFSVDIIRFKDLEPLIIPELEKRGIVTSMNVHTTFFFLPPDKYISEHKDWYAHNSRSVNNPSENEIGKSWCANNSRKYEEVKKEKLDFYLSNIRLYFSQPIDASPLMPDNNITPWQRMFGLSRERGMEIPTQICYSNKKAIRTYCSNITEYLRTHPQVKLIGLWPSDLGHYCKCKKCAADSQVILKASIYIAQQLARKFPDVIVEHLVYTGPSRSLPDENLAIPKNMVVLQATGDQKTADAWTDKCRKSRSLGVYKIIYTLADNFAQQGHVCINPQKAMEEFNYLRSQSFQGFDVMYIDMYSYWRSCQNLSFFARLAWQKNLSLAAYLDEFCKSYYETACRPMQVIYQKLLELNLEALFGDASGAICEQNSAILADCQELLKKAGKSACDNKIKARLNKMDVYLNHLMLYKESGFYSKRSKILLGEKKIQAAAVMMHRVSMKEEEIKAVCFDSFCRGDGVLDFRLTLLLRKFDRFCRYRDMLNEMLNGLKTQSTKRRPGKMRG